MEEYERLASEVKEMGGPSSAHLQPGVRQRLSMFIFVLFIAERVKTENTPGLRGYLLYSNMRGANVPPPTPMVFAKLSVVCMFWGGRKGILGLALPLQGQTLKETSRTLFCPLVCGLLASGSALFMSRALFSTVTPCERNLYNLWGGGGVMCVCVCVHRPRVGSGLTFQKLGALGMQFWFEQCFYSSFFCPYHSIESTKRVPRHLCCCPCVTFVTWAQAEEPQSCVLWDGTQVKSHIQDQTNYILKIV